jgi:hypothetical protein
VPPDGLDVSVIDWPLSIDGDVGVIGPGMSVGLTVTVSTAEQTDSGEYAESVNL